MVVKGMSPTERLIQNGQKIVFGYALGNGKKMVPKWSKNGHPWPGGAGETI